MNPVHLAVLLFALALAATGARGSRLDRAGTADERHVVLHWLDGEVRRVDDGQGEHAFGGHESAGRDEIVQFGPPLNLELAADPATYDLRDADGDRVEVKAVHRKTKVNGVPMIWPDPPHTLAHTVFLELAGPMEPGRYTIALPVPLDSDRRNVAFDYDPAAGVTDAIHVNLAGYEPDAPVKSADLYLWRGDGGPRDYSDVVGNAVRLVDVETGESRDVGTVKHWQERQKDYGGWDLTGSDVWTIDFGDFDGEGTFRLSVDGVGSSRPFEVRRGATRDPFALSVLGFYYMRIGEPMDPAGHSTMSADLPPPRQPRFIPGEDPAGFRVIRTTMGPNHPEFGTLGGDPWDNKDWSAYVEEGEPTNPDAHGGHSDALDWDRRFQHINIVFDLCLPFVLRPDGLMQDDLDIREIGNGVPDLLDSAMYEADFWRRLRDGEGNFSFGVNNPTEDHTTAYQAAAGPWMAHANAAMSAMLADCLRLAGRDEESADYLETARDAYRRGGDDALDETHNVGNGNMRGRDLKALAAGYLYKLTGEQRFEDDFSALIDLGETLIDKDRFTKTWAAAAYLSNADEGLRPVNHPDLLARLREVAAADAEANHLAHSASFPSRRSSDPAFGWFPTVIEVGPLLLAHRYGEGDDREKYLSALLLESDYSLGRNPLNLVLMTGPGERHIQEAYTTGRDDGFPGVHPGHTPYMNARPWGNNFMSDPQWMASRGHPEWGQWPYGEALWNNWYNFANNEFTPQQTMAAKTGMYAYLHAALGGR